MPAINVVFEPETQIGTGPLDPYAKLCLRVAQVVKDQLQSKPDSCFGLPTGRTPTGVYAVLAQWSREGLLDWSSATAFGLDEYCDVDESVSFRAYLQDNLYRYTNFPRRFNPLFAEDYDGDIAKSGGLDLTLLGIGKNGHIAFNEPGTPLNSWTHSVLLTESTRIANAEFFKTGQIPTHAVTMGIQTILKSKRIILIASGESKRTIVTRALQGPVTEEVPASFLQLHRDVVVMTDFTL